MFGKKKSARLKIIAKDDGRQGEHKVMVQFGNDALSVETDEREMTVTDIKENGIRVEVNGIPKK